MGDSVDNVVGVEKCGPKTAAKWLGEHGTLDGVIAAAPGIKGKIGDNLRGALERLPLNRDLVTIKTDVVLDGGPETLALRERDTDKLRELFTRYAMSQALRELDGGAAAVRSEEHTSELQSLMRISYAVFCLKKKKNKNIHHQA